MVKCIALSLLLIVSTVRCIDREEGPNYHKTIMVYNNSGIPIYVSSAWAQNADPEWGKYPHSIGDNLQKYLVKDGETNRTALALNLGNSYEGILGGWEEGRYIYMLDVEMIDSQIENEDKGVNFNTIIDYRRFSLEDLQSTNFYISYPW